MEIFSIFSRIRTVQVNQETVEQVVKLVRLTPVENEDTKMIVGEPRILTTNTENNRAKSRRQMKPRIFANNY